MKTSRSERRYMFALGPYFGMSYLSAHLRMTATDTPRETAASFARKYACSIGCGALVRAFSALPHASMVWTSYANSGLRAPCVSAGDRRARLATITAPTLVIHGADDPLIPPACGRDTALSIPDAIYIPIEGMGHDLPNELNQTVIEAICDVAKK